MTMSWITASPESWEACGLIPHFLDADDPRPAAEQINDRYDHGGGWRPLPGFTLRPDLWLCYPEDPPLEPLAMTILPASAETVVIYPAGFVVILQRTDRTWQAARLD
jgi:hypothetical protein